MQLDQIKRREFITLLGGAAAWPLAAEAQQPERMRRIGILMPYAPTDMEVQARVRAFQEELRKKGWARGVNVQFDERWTTDNMDLVRAAAANLAELQPDAILAVGGRVIPILMQATGTVPIVVPGGPEPVERGWIKSLARPGGNVTGFANLEHSVIGKMLQTLKELAPSITRVAMLYNPDNVGATLFVRSFEAAAPPLGVQAIPSPIHGLADIERAVVAMAAQPNGGIFAAPDVTITSLMKEIVALITRHRLPAIYSERFAIAHGGLAFYGVDRIEFYRGAASYVDRILRGEKPGDLPYQQPTKYELVINRKAATALGLEIPPRLLFTADEVIE
jgi:putative tryptophan/tyrosine transport system substrate-binding protein